MSHVSVSTLPTANDTSAQCASCSELHNIFELRHPAVLQHNVHQKFLNYMIVIEFFFFLNTV